MKIGQKNLQNLWNELKRFIDYKHKSLRTSKFSGYKLVEEKYQMPNLQWVRRWNAVYSKIFQHNGPESMSSYGIHPQMSITCLAMQRLLYHWPFDYI